MEKNYYEILEVDKKASNEIIEKAYKTLAKKYHPDLQESQTQKEYEEKMKLINEAYSVLSDDYKRNEYDNHLQENIISLEQYQAILQENKTLKQEIQRLSSTQTRQAYNTNNNVYNTQQTYNTSNNIYNRQYQEQVNRAVNQAYQDAYVQDMKNRGYKIRYKRTFKQYVKLAATILCIILVCALIYHIPFVKKFFTDLYNENIVVKSIVDIFINTFTTKF